MRRWILVGALGLVGCAGVTFYICPTHCYEYRVESDAVQDNNEDGYFDDLCVNHHTSNEMDAPIPELGFPGRACALSQDEHEAIKTVITAKLENDLGSLSQAQIDAYEDYLEKLTLRIRNVCVDRGLPPYLIPFFEAVITRHASPSCAKA